MDANGGAKESVDMLENGIDCPVAMSADAPALDNACVVPV